MILDLMINAVEAMSGDGGRARELLISTAKTESDVLVAVRDSGPRFAPENVDRIFESFYTTKPRRFGDRVIDLPLDHRSTWRTSVGDRE